MSAGAVLITIAGSGERNINLSDEALKEINSYIEMVIVKEEMASHFHDKMLQEILNAVEAFSSFGMTFDEYWDYERKLTSRSYSKEQYSLSFNRPSIRHQVDNRKPRHLVKKIIY